MTSTYTKAKLPTRRQLLPMLAMLFAALLFAGVAQAGSHGDEQPEMAKVTPSPMSFPDTVEAFEAQAKEAGWSVLNKNYMSGVLSERGFTLDPVVIIDVCSGEYSARILEEDEFRPVSAFMPCRVSIYQDSQGDVFISRMNVSAFLPMMPDEVAEVMELSSNEVEAIIEQTVAE
ncbi:DUF302 domain-containing protein [Aquisalimonas sp.]|uniref:DUF302 domain-containing protein n=1 Tax=Aquisalimonas sp. TaxID=1872621 RepID=UPI0025C2705C|nr:DUF302 domain-containing protein [Aquisalimonas sp.]